MVTVETIDVVCFNVQTTRVSDLSRFSCRPFGKYHSLTSGVHDSLMGVLSACMHSDTLTVECVESTQ